MRRLEAMRAAPRGNGLDDALGPRIIRSRSRSCDGGAFAAMELTAAIFRAGPKGMVGEGSHFRAC